MLTVRRQHTCDANIQMSRAPLQTFNDSVVGDFSLLDNRARPPLDYEVCEKTSGAVYPRATLKSEGAMIHFIN